MLCVFAAHCLWSVACTRRIMMTVLMMKGVHGSILFGLLFCTFVSWIPGHAASFFTAPGFDGESPLGTRVGLDGRQRYDFFRKVS